MPKSRERFYSNPGSKFEPEYAPYYDENGVLELCEIGQKNIYNEIQSYADECDINILIQRYMAGEIDVFERVKGFYADVSDMPKTYQELLNTNIRAEKFFDSLPVETKKKFNNSYSEFLCSMDKPEFMEIFIQNNEKPIEELKEVLPEKEVISDES